METFFGEFAVTRGADHNYLGMKIKLRRDKKVEIDTRDQIKGIINYFSETIKGKVTSPATDELYVQLPNDKELVGVRKEEFHSVTAKLFLLKNNHNQT